MNSKAKKECVNLYRQMACKLPFFLLFFFTQLLYTNFCSAQVFKYEARDTTRFIDSLNVNGVRVSIARRLLLQETGFADFQTHSILGRTLSFATDSTVITEKESSKGFSFTNYAVKLKLGTGWGAKFLTGVSFTFGTSLIKDVELFIEPQAMYQDQVRGYLAGGFYYRLFGSE